MVALKMSSYTQPAVRNKTIFNRYKWIDTAIKTTESIFRFIILWI